MAAKRKIATTMKTPIVTEQQLPLEPVARDTFIAALDRSTPPRPASR